MYNVWLFLFGSVVVVALTLEYAFASSVFSSRHNNNNKKTH